MGCASGSASKDLKESLPVMSFVAKDLGKIPEGVLVSLMGQEKGTALQKWVGLHASALERPSIFEGDEPSMYFWPNRNE